MSEPKLLLSALQGKKVPRVPFWFMRQAGRYLPEYRALRASCSGFMDLCFTPEKAAEVTIQPIARFDMDGAILFSDILVIPYALGCDVTFEAGEGPKLTVIQTEEALQQLSHAFIHEKLGPIYETIARVKKQLPSHTTFLGFAGAPWTVACYMLQGKGGEEFATARQLAHRNPLLVKKLIDIITDATIVYLKKQIETGVDAVQIFDSWSGLLTPAQFSEYCLMPTQKIVRALKATYPHTPIIGFPKGAAGYLETYATISEVDAIGIDQFTPLAFAKTQTPEKILQGNLDPLLLASNQQAMLQQAQTIVDTMKNSRFVFNLGHGMVPHTPVENVEALVQFLKASSV
jgi:uroporphyrinogen decarboxylase